MYKRILITFIIIMGCFCFSFFILDSISTKENFREAATNQQSYRLNISDVRGTIYDCRNIPLVNRSKKLVAAVIPSMESLTALTSVINDTQKDELYKKCLGNTPFTIEIQKYVECPYIKVFEVPIRYSNVTLAPHIIGYLSNEKKGVCGIEKSYDDYLSSKNKKICIRYDIDASGKILPGGHKIIEDRTYFNSKGIVLNLDSRIQTIAEEIANKYMNRGAVIITEVPDCQIRGCVSLPSFSPNNVGDYLEDKNSPFLNRILCSFNLGSIFKLITSAAALEKGVSEEFLYDCSGVYELKDAKFKCFNCKSHGNINMEQAIAHSCNGYFIELIKNIVSKDELLKMSSKFGLGKELMFAEGINSKEGKLPSSESLSDIKTLANFSFGQGKLLATPLQIAGMINAIASNGIYSKPKLIKGFVGENMKFLNNKFYSDLQKREKIISPKTAKKLKSFMKASVDYGTSSKGRPENVDIAAKTSTAQTGIIEDGKRIEQSWFAGFFPYENPKYSIVVLSEAGNGGGESSGPIFKEIVEKMYQEIPELFLVQ